MHRRLRLLFVVLIAGPLVGLAVLGVWTARNEEARAENDLRAVLVGKLDDLAADLGTAVAELERSLLADTEALPGDPEALRALCRTHPRLGHLLVLDARGRLQFPPPDGPMSERERRFVDESRELWERGALANPARDELTGATAPHGWQAAAGADGFGLIFWRRQPTAGRVAVMLPGASVLATLVARLPATPVGLRVSARSAYAPAPADERVALEDPAGQIAYQWGAFAAPENAAPLVTRALAPPLGAWRLAYLGPRPRHGRTTVPIVAGLVALGAAIAGAGSWLYRESTRELRLAAERVSFVNQVSHELKTPLTNIRMYAELLEDHVPLEDGPGRTRLDIVVTESQRLGRLINNILTFSRKEKGHLTVHPAPAAVDDIVKDVVAQFAPGFEARGVVVRTELSASALVRVDADALSQILGNMLGNVEKYAPGGEVRIRTAASPPLTIVTVHDSGPGIAAAEAERVFQPFVRLGAVSHQGVPGTGIGLGIARDLARLHGGDLRLCPSPQGACFELTLRTEDAR